MRGTPTPLHAEIFRYHYPAANTAAIVTVAAVAGVTHVLHWIWWSYDTAPTGGKVTVTINSVVVAEIEVATGQGSPLHDCIPFPGGIYGGNNEELKITVAAGGASVVGKVSVKTT